ncbi:MAG: tripartite tricarboxylate transporter substrate binding protein [Burkholderiales bacterium]|nr:tripartite tricarboxylate transporter substrate binding protein [Burkholderiales bacterium]
MPSLQPMRLPARSLPLAAAFFAAALAGVPAASQDYPVKPVRVVVPFSAGGAHDVILRILAPSLAESLGQQVIVENRAGGASTIGMEHVAKSKPDGYTLGVANVSLAVNPFLFSKLPYDTERDFAPVGMVARVGYVLMVHPSVPARSVQELIALGRARPGQLNYASAGNATGGHMGMAYFLHLTGVKMVHVPFGTGARPVISVVSGETTIYMGTIPPALGFFRSGKLIPLAVSSAQRHPLLPQVPTIAESGLPGFEVGEWSSIVVPAGTPRAAIDRAQQSIAKAVALSEVKERMASVGAVSAASTPEELGAHIKGELAKWKKVVETAGIRVNE